MMIITELLIECLGGEQNFNIKINLIYVIFNYIIISLLIIIIIIYYLIVIIIIIIIIIIMLQ